MLEQGQVEVRNQVVHRLNRNRHRPRLLPGQRRLPASDGLARCLHRNG